jgi:hypothetical protein
MLIKKPIVTIIAQGAALIVAIIIFSSCGSIRKYNGLKRINLIVNYPIVIMNDGVNDAVNFFNLKDTVWIFYYDSKVLYRLSETRNLETDKKILGTETWFIYREKAKHGFLFNSISDSSRGLKLLVDSFLNNRAYASANFNIPSDSLFAKDQNKEEKFVEKYHIKVHTDNYPDSIYYYFTNELKNIDYSFSQKLDTLKNMKLYKVRLLYNETFSLSYQAIIPKREFLFEIREEAIADSKEIINFFERIKGQIIE